MFLGINISLVGKLRSSAADVYGIGGFSPDLVFDFAQEYYRTGGSQTTFDSAMTLDRSSNATMVDSDGLLKWAPHNLLPYSEQFDNAGWVKSSCIISANAIIAPDGTLTADEVIPDTTSLSVTRPYNIAGTYTARIWVKDAGRGACAVSMGTNTIGYLINIDLTDGSYISGRSYGGGVLVGYTIADAGLGWYRVSVTATANTGGVSVFGGDGVSSDSGIYIWGAHLYRSDLGGMVDNPDRGDSYVPTTSAARYLPRRGHHVYNGAEWVNEGVLVEPTAATNLVTYSNDPTNINWTNPAGRISVGAETLNGPFGTYRSLTNTVTGTGAHQIYQIGKTLVSGETYAAFSLVKYSSGSGWFVVNMYDTTDANTRAWFDVQNGVKGTAAAGISDYDIEDWGDGWYLCWATKTASSTSGGVSFETPNGDGVGTYTSGDQIFFAGAQLEAASTPSSYIPTSGSTVTRAADTLTVPSANLPWPTPNVIGPELVTDISPSAWAASGLNTVTQDGSGNTVVTYVDTSIGADFSLNTTSGGLSENLVAGRLYQLSVTIDTGGDFIGLLRATSLSPNYNVTVTTSGFETFTHIFTSDGSEIFRVDSMGAGEVATISNISVREIDPLAVSIQMEGRATGDTLTTTRWYLDANNYITQEINTSDFTFEQANAGTVDAVTGGSFTSGVNTSFNIASRHGSTFINGAVDGTALTANTTPTALPDLSTTDLSLAHSGGPMILKKVRIWNEDLGDSGIEEASA